MFNPKNKTALTGRNTQPKHGQQPGPARFEAKTNARRPVAPPAYRPQQGNNPVQPKTAQRHAPPAAPPVYRPQPVPKCLQPKLSDSRQPVVQKPLTPKAPPAYRPQAIPKVLQTKKHIVPHPVNQPRNTPAAPQVYRPQRGQADSPAKSVAPGIPSPSLPGRRGPHTVQAKPRASFKPGRSAVIQPVMHDVEMRSQLLTEGTLFDLNCGRYCSEAAIKWWGKRLELQLQDDIFHDLLPEPTPKDVGLFSIKAAWSPAREGAEFATRINKPTTIAEWDKKLSEDGPITVSGKLGAADWGFLGGPDHFILIVGADVDTGKLYYKDPLQGDRGPIEGDFKDMNARITGAYVVNFEKLTMIHLQRQAQLKADEVTV